MKKFIWFAWAFYILFQPFRFIGFIVGSLVGTYRVGYVEARSLIGGIRIK